MLLHFHSSRAKARAALHTDATPREIRHGARLEAPRLRRERLPVVRLRHYPGPVKLLIIFGSSALLWGLALWALAAWLG